jgi:hypothetical protein
MPNCQWCGHPHEDGPCKQCACQRFISLADKRYIDQRDVVTYEKFGRGGNKYIKRGG